MIRGLILTFKQKKSGLISSEDWSCHKSLAILLKAYMTNYFWQIDSVHYHSYWWFLYKFSPTKTVPPIQWCHYTSWFGIPIGAKMKCPYLGINVIGWPKHCDQLFLKVAAQQPKTSLQPTEVFSLPNHYKWTDFDAVFS